MKNLLFAVLSTALFLTACQKDEDITFTDITIPDSEQLPSIAAKGLVTDELGEVLPGSTVQLFNEDGLLLGQTTTDQQGRFSIEEVTSPSSKLLIYGEKPDYNSNAKKLDSSPGNLENIHLQLPSSNLYSEFAMLNPADPNLIALSGSVIDNNGSPADAFILAYAGGELINVVIALRSGIR